MFVIAPKRCIAWCISLAQLDSYVCMLEEQIYSSAKSTEQSLFNAMLGPNDETML